MYPLNNLQINSILSRHYHTRPFYGGCYAANTLPTVVNKYPTFIICNLDMSWQFGSHWLFIGLTSR